MKLLTNFMSILLIKNLFKIRFIAKNFRNLFIFIIVSQKKLMFVNYQTHTQKKSMWNTKAQFFNKKLYDCLSYFLYFTIHAMYIPYMILFYLRSRLNILNNGLSKTHVHSTIKCVALLRFLVQQNHFQLPVYETFQHSFTIASNVNFNNLNM